jgi:hypothetical protein
MKDSKFIELLNLYIDRQISPEDAARLEEEILQDPRRRQVYAQYCKMQRACTLVFEDFRIRAAQTAPAAGQVASRVAEFEPRRHKRAIWGYYAAGLAAAACVTLVAVQIFFRSGAPATQDHPVVLPGPNAGSTHREVITTSVPVRMDATPRWPSQPSGSLVAQRLQDLSFASNRSTTPLVIVNFPPGMAAPTPVLPVKAVASKPRSAIEQFVFGQPAASPGTPQIFRRRSMDEQTEMTAFQFQR